MADKPVTRSVVADPLTHYGNGKAATRSFRLQRLSGGFNILFIAFLVFIITRLAGQDRVDMVQTVGTPLVGLPFAVLFAVVCFHMRIGMHDIIEDYVHEHGTNRLANTANVVFCVLVGLVGVLSILKLVFWG